LFNKIAAMAVLTILAAGVAPAALITIDDFNTTQFLGIGPGGVNPLTGSGGVLDGNVVGGARSVTITRTAGTGLQYVNVNSSIFEFNTGSADNAFGRILYDGDTNASLNTAGLNLNLSSSNYKFRFDSKSDNPGTGYVVLFSSPTAYSYYQFALPDQGFAAAFSTQSIALSAFLQGAPALVQADLGLAVATSAVNLSQVGAIAVYFDGTAGAAAGLDAQLDLLELTDVPEPASFGLVGGVLIAAAFARRFRR
jgi:hypothetical protein